MSCCLVWTAQKWHAVSGRPPTDTLNVVAGLEAGVDDYVPKPFTVAELLARIRARFRIAKPEIEESAAGGAKTASITTMWNTGRSSSIVWSMPSPRTARI